MVLHINGASSSRRSYWITSNTNLHQICVTGALQRSAELVHEEASTASILPVCLRWERSGHARVKRRPMRADIVIQILYVPVRTAVSQIWYVFVGISNLPIRNLLLASRRDISNDTHLLNVLVTQPDLANWHPKLASRSAIALRSLGFQA